ncbi:PREDICTED: cholecystokinin receptor-like isoform X2 [Rhagoletis zephyria]|uniref:cholecystokinin receptor-like isoform X2 n=1 Tax=Rhagoletis zephyria TaxID=28612 RepID=UPI0008112E63|nr:PREDICTED: cholecystokinin receptor-like isoform X2 [Rhagoletis zephyria]
MAEAAEKKKYTRITKSQLKWYVQFVKNNPLIISGKNTPSDPQAQKRLWNEVARNLNAMYGPDKTPEKWKEMTENQTEPPKVDVAPESDMKKTQNQQGFITYPSLKTSSNRISPRKTQYVSMGNTSNASTIYPGRMSQKDRRLLKMILVIFISFLFCHLPITITKIWKGATVFHIVNISGYLLIYLTTCINPLIYVFMSNEYRQAYWNLLRCRQKA